MALGKQKTALVQSIAQEASLLSDAPGHVGIVGRQVASLAEMILLLSGMLKSVQEATKKPDKVPASTGKPKEQ